MTNNIKRAEIETMTSFAPSWLLVDEIASCRPPCYIRTLKQLDRADRFIAEHFPLGPMIFPGVLLIEFASQSAYLLEELSQRVPCPPEARLLARCTAQFLSPAYAGDLITAEVTLVESANGVSLHEGVVTCGERIICRTKIFGASMPALRSKSDEY